MFREAELDEMPASGASAVHPIRRQSSDESPERSIDPIMENRPCERREGGEGGELVSAGSIRDGLDTDVSCFIIYIHCVSNSR